MGDKELLDAAIARLEELRDGHSGYGSHPWHDEAHGDNSYTTRVISADGFPVPGCFNCGDNEGIYEGTDAAFIAAMSRAVEPVLDILGTEARRIIQNGGVREDQSHFNALSLARSLLANETEGV